MSLVRFAPLVLFSLLLTSCYTRDINLQVEVDRSAVYSLDSSAIYFVAKASAWKRGKDFWFIMPIEGKAKSLYNNFSLYHYQIQEQELTPMLDLGDVPYNLGSWKIVLIPSEHAVLMTISPLTGWEGSRRHGIQEIRDRLDRVFIIEFSGELSDAVPDFLEDNLWKANYTYLDSIVRSFPYATFGLYLKEIDPASDREYIRTLTSLENTDSYHRLVIEQVVSQKDKKAIRRVYKKMKKSVDRLSGDEKSDMERLTRRNFKRLEKLMEE